MMTKTVLLVSLAALQLYQLKILTNVEKDIMVKTVMKPAVLDVQTKHVNLTESVLLVMKNAKMVGIPTITTTSVRHPNVLVLWTAALKAENA